jgi:glutaconate CoA-transferase subunit A
VADKRMTVEEAVAEVSDGMTIGIGGWGSRRKPMAFVRALVRKGVKDLTVVSYGGPDIGILCATGQLRKAVYGFVSLDSIPLEPHFRKARQEGTIEATELDEGMFLLGLRAAAQRLPFLPTRAGLGSDVMKINPHLKTVKSPYADGEELVAVPALNVDVAFMSCEKLVSTEELVAGGPLQSLRINRMMVSGVVEAPGGAHFTECPPDYPRDEAFQREYAKTAKDKDAWSAFRSKYLDSSEAAYQKAVSS